MTKQKIEAFWRDATAEDIARVMKGEKVEARFAISEGDWSGKEWVLLNANDEQLRLIGWHEGFWVDSDGDHFKQCQVYDPPKWYIDKPDPGEGWRLLEKFPHESKLPTDEYWSNVCSQWLQIGGSDATPQADQLQVENVWYRRRIEPVRQDAGSTSASNIPKGWTALLLDEPRLASDAFWSQDAEAWIIIGDGWVEAANREKWPAIRQVETHKTMMLLEGCFYRLPNGQGIKVTKKGFDVF